MRLEAHWGGIYVAYQQMIEALMRHRPQKAIEVRLLPLSVFHNQELSVRSRTPRLHDGFEEPAVFVTFDPDRQTVAHQLQNLEEVLHVQFVHADLVSKKPLHRLLVGWPFGV